MKLIDTAGMLERTNLLEWWVLLLYDWQCQSGDHPQLHCQSRVRCGASSTRLKTSWFSRRTF